MSRYFPRVSFPLIETVERVLSWLLLGLGLTLALYYKHRFMPQELKVISINFRFKAPWVVQEPTLATSRALFDFDVVVLRPYLLVGTRPPGKSSIESREYYRARNEIDGKVPDIRRLWYQGGLLVVILDVLQELNFHSGAHVYSGGTMYTVVIFIEFD